MTDLSNHEPAFNATDEMIRGLATDYNKGSVSKIDFIKRTTEKFLANELRHVPLTKQGAVATEEHYAEYAVDVWSSVAVSKKKKGALEVVESPGSRKSELKAVFQAARAKNDVCDFAHSLSIELRDKYAGNKDIKFDGNTYKAIIKVAQAQARNLKVVITREEAIAALMPAPVPADEIKELTATIKALEKMAKRWPESAAGYNAMIAATAPVMDALVVALNRDIFLRDSLERGQSFKAAMAYYEAPAKAKALENGTVWPELTEAQWDAAFIDFQSRAARLPPAKKAA